MRAFQNTMTTPRTEHGLGFYHKDVDGFVVMEMNFNVFMDKIYSHRIAAELFIGSGWREEVMNRSCEQSNVLCKNTGEPSRAVTFADVKQFGLVAQRYLEKGGSKVSQEEAERRASICVSCPHNKPLTGICPSCGAWAAWLLQLGTGVSSSQDSNLFNCGICGCYLPLSIHVPLEIQADARYSKDDAPNFCWKREAFSRRA